MYKTVTLAFALAMVFAGAAHAQIAVAPIPLSSSQIERLTKKAESGDVNAQVQLGESYRDGRGVDKDLGLAKMWLQRAADQGAVAAELDLGIQYLYMEQPSDYALARMWLRKAAGHGSGDAQYFLGRMCAEGLGAAPDYVEAYMWFDLADRTDALNQPGRARDDVARKMTEAQIAEAKARVAAWTLSE